MSNYYVISILYHSIKENVEVDTLSQNIATIKILVWYEVSRHPLTIEVQILTNGFIRLQVTKNGGVLVHVRAKLLSLKKLIVGNLKIRS